VGSAIFGIADILLLFFLVLHLTKNKTIALLSSLFFAFSPWSIQFSRVNWETNYGLFFFFLGILLFLKGLEKKNFWLVFAFASFGIDIFTYNAAKVFVPLFVLAMVIVYSKDLLKNKIAAFLGLLVFFGFILINVVSPDLSGLTRLGEVTFNTQEVESTYLYKLTKHQKIGVVQLIAQNYLSHFTPQFLFISGDHNPRHSIQTMGELYYYDVLLLPFGIFFLVKSKNKWSWLVLVWFFLAPIPASIATEAPHASRTMFALGGWQIVSATGFFYLLTLIKKENVRFWLIIFSCVVFFLFVDDYSYKYIWLYPTQYSSDWQYGYMKIFTDYKNDFGKYTSVIVSDQDGQPYIFALYYLKYDPNSFRQTVIYNPESNWGASTVKSFGNFIFKKVEASDLQKNTLVFATPNDEIKGVIPNGEIKNLDGSAAFWIYSK
jgi:hypothetical protein